MDIKKRIDIYADGPTIQEIQLINNRFLFEHFIK